MLAFRLDQTGREGFRLNEAGKRRAAVDLQTTPVSAKLGHLPFLRIPPFPNAHCVDFARPAAAAVPISGEQVDALLEEIGSLQAGGTYWGSQPALPEEGFELVRVTDPKERAERVAAARAGERLVVWIDSAENAQPASVIVAVTGECDPWHLLHRASRLVVDADDELALIAAIIGTPIECVGSGRFASLAGKPTNSALRDAFRQHVLDKFDYFDPYSGELISFADALRICGFWRELIDSNRSLAGAVGFAFWKRGTVARLLWRGLDHTPFLSDASNVREGDPIAAWRTRTPPKLLCDLERRGAALVEVEDGFIRSAGLGADCVPPLSIIVDRLGPHFDPRQPSKLEQLLEDGDFPTELLNRARSLRELIVASGLSKYSAGHAPLQRRVAERRHILVPGQVEDDRAVISGGAGLTSNLELLRRVRAENPEAYLIYKPHPDVEAGHRKGAIVDDLCLSVADEIVRDEPITALIDLVDEVHVNSSLAGFEALLREKRVTTHGVPFYAGWGLTRDLGPVPKRRTAERTLDELVAAALLLYPRYVDPLTGLPCPAEILVRRLAEARHVRRDGMLVTLRRLQGRFRRTLAMVWNRR